MIQQKLKINKNRNNMSNLPLPKDRTLFFAKQVEQSSIESLTKSIIEINENDTLLKKMYAVYDIDYVAKPIKIMIDSYGGQVYQIFGLLAIMDESKTPIHTYVTGAAMSCGFMLLIHGHKRFAYKHATPLYHQVSSGTMGKVKDMEEKLEEAKRLQGLIETLTLEKTKITAKKLERVYKTKKDWYMTAEEALKLGVIDEIV
jgi:ATP-dependent Clp protease protease subunit